MLKVAIAGKGGAGKTMLASCLAYLMAENGDTVYAVDADPNPTLGQALGFPEELLRSIHPILSMRDLIKERTGISSSDSYTTYFKLNPSVKDIPVKFSAQYRDIRLLIMGSTRGANTGCACAENAITKALISHLVLQARESVIMDMVAGTEHLGRGTASGVDCLIITVEPSMRSLQSAKATESIVQQFDNMNYLIVGNKIRNNQDKDFIESNFDKKLLAGCIPWKKEMLEAENKRVPVYDAVPEVIEIVKQVKENFSQISRQAIRHSFA